MKKVLLFTISWRGSPKEASRLIENGLPHINRFHICKWISQEPGVIMDIPEAD